LTRSVAARLVASSWSPIFHLTGGPAPRNATFEREPSLPTRTNSNPVYVESFAFGQEARVAFLVAASPFPDPSAVERRLVELVAALTTCPGPLNPSDAAVL
jgi:hypothetical protein